MRLILIIITARVSDTSGPLIRNVSTTFDIAGSVLAAVGDLSRLNGFPSRTAGAEPQAIPVFFLPSRIIRVGGQCVSLDSTMI